MTAKNTFPTFRIEAQVVKYSMWPSVRIVKIWICATGNEADNDEEVIIDFKKSYTEVADAEKFIASKGFQKIFKAVVASGI